MSAPSILVMTPAGLYCPAGDFYVDPRPAVSKAVITHAHSDHARAGHRAVLAHPLTLAVIRKRIDPMARGQALEYGTPVELNGARVSLHPSGHVPGSAQVRIEYKGFVAVVTGDFKIEHDGLTDAYEQQRCHWFITECTFGIPVFRWETQAEIFKQVIWQYRENVSRDTTTILTAYALGKAQRLAHMLAPHVESIVVHRTVAPINAALSKAGLPLPPTKTLNATTLADHSPSRLIIAPGSALRESWVRRIGSTAVYTVSGWVALQTRRRTSSGFALSDHADYPGLLQAVRDTGAERISVDHGYVNEFCAALRKERLTAEVLREEKIREMSRSEGDQLALPF